MNTSRTIALVATLAATTALITSCSSEHDAASKNPKTAPVSNARSNIDKKAWPKAIASSGLAQGLSLPLQQYMQTYQDTVTLDNAQRQLQTACMADYGFHITFPPAGQTPPPSADDANMSRRYGITDQATAAKYAYGLPEDSQNQEGTKMPDLTKEQIEVLTGRTSIRTKPTDPEPEPAPSEYNGKPIHKDGCAGWADDQLGLRGLDFSLVSQLDGDSLGQSQQVPAVQSAISAWSKCMADKGYTAATPYDADKVTPHTDGTTTQNEIDVALTDIGCKKSTNLVESWFDEETKLQNQQIKDHQGELDTMRTRNTNALAAAQKVLNG
ncbi:hypothetical protein AB0O47_19365 [Streptomyces noursei]|uniref:hypothetical protein n=1 Tax=Streptomyces noursei TaxID=1971 RepID=UPI00344E7C85